MNPLITVCISITASTLIAVFGSYWAFRIQFERFLARDTEREKHWNEWRANMTRDVEQLKAERNFHGRIEQCERFIEELREWKHVKFDAYIRAADVMNERVTQLEKKP